MALQKAQSPRTLDLEGLREAMDSRHRCRHEVQQAQAELNLVEEGIAKAILRAQAYDLVTINWRKVDKLTRTLKR